jgi:hypothetical protein
MATNSNPIPLLPSALAYHSLGASVIPTRAKTKKGAVRWKPYQVERADEATIREWFTDTDNGNLGIGIVLGAISGGLLCRDFDQQSSYEAWKASHRTLANELPTSKTSRGCHVYARCDDYKPADKRTFVLTLPDGELRGDCHISIVPPSLHAKSGLPYTWLVEPKVRSGRRSRRPGNQPDVTHVVSVTCSPPPTSLSSCPPPPVCVTSVAEAIQATMPDGPGQRNRQLFEFARYLKAMPEIGDWTADDLMPFVRQWFQAALPHIGTKEFDETAKDFKRGWVSIKFPGGVGVGSVAAALARAKLTPLPPEAAQFIIPELRLLVHAASLRQRERDLPPCRLLVLGLRERSGVGPGYWRCSAKGIWSRSEANWNGRHDIDTFHQWIRAGLHGFEPRAKRERANSRPQPWLRHGRVTIVTLPRGGGLARPDRTKGRLLLRISARVVDHRKTGGEESSKAALRGAGTEALSCRLPGAESGIKVKLKSNRQTSVSIAIDHTSGLSPSHRPRRPAARRIAAAQRTAR